MVSTPEGFTENNLIAVNISGHTKNPSERNFLNLVSKLFNIKQKRSARILGDAETKCKAIRTGE